MRLNDKGQCPICERKPLTYKRDRHYFCPRCWRSFDLGTGQQIENWAFFMGPKGWLKQIKQYAHTMDCDGVIRMKSRVQPLDGVLPYGRGE
jgi:transposase-like protein